MKTKLTEEQAKEKRTASFKAWYVKNKEKLAAQRKIKYQSNPAYRAKIVEASKVHQQLKPRESKKKDRMTVDQLCEKAGMSVHTFRKYQQEGIIPVFHGIRPTFTSIHVAVLGEFTKALRDTRYLRGLGVRTAALAPVVSKVSQIFSQTQDTSDLESFIQ